MRLQLNTVVHWVGNESIRRTMVCDDSGMMTATNILNRLLSVSLGQSYR